ncbi:hypothetical protein [Streptomyces sp. I6]|uniref:hypothetical protein n=1 Tax=Streptomyces sp. I6 TaxID=2483113 RepID=UPI000F44FDB1|nr:hypothetical protein [Streptomyces sp. I6]RNL71158.1 hypothetical protein EBF04_09055 [Streptomyces sp. I6]
MAIRMTAATRSSRARWRRWALPAVVAVTATAAALTLFVVGARSGPEHRTVFLVDASEVTSRGTPSPETAAQETPSPGTASQDTDDDYDFSDITDAVAATALNTADDDALSLRRYGGTCDDTPGNTTQVIDDAKQNGRTIADAARTLKPTGQPTLHSGILAAVDDLSQSDATHNRVIVITAHGTDACTEDTTKFERELRERLESSGLLMDFRFVGHRVPKAEQRSLIRTADVGNAPEPVFTDTSEELASTLAEFVLPESYEALPAELPESAAADVFRPVAWTTAKEVRLLEDPAAKPRTLASLDSSANPGTVAWSADRMWIAWTEISEAGTAVSLAGHRPEGVIRLMNLADGTVRTWDCEYCGIVFAGDRLISNGSDGTGLWAYPSDGGAPAEWSAKGLPAVRPEEQLGPTTSCSPTGWERNWPPTHSRYRMVHRLTACTASLRMARRGESSPRSRGRLPGRRPRRHADDRERGGRRPRRPGPLRTHEPTNHGSHPRLGDQSAAVAPGAGWAPFDAWFTADGSAYVSYLPYHTRRIATGYCDFAHNEQPRAYVLQKGAGEWALVSDAERRVRAIGGGWRAVSVRGDGAAALTITGRGQSRTLDRAVVEVFPSSGS